MGGIKEDNIGSIAELGVRRFAMVTEITQAEDVRGKVERLRAAISSVKGAGVKG